MSLRVLSLVIPLAIVCVLCFIADVWDAARPPAHDDLHAPQEHGEGA